MVAKKVQGNGIKAKSIAFKMGEYFFLMTYLAMLAAAIKILFFM
jgi:hypothetical protein